MPTDPSDAPAIKQPFVLRPDGTIWATVHDMRLRLRVPKFAELVALRTDIQSRLDESADRAEQLRPGQTAWIAREQQLIDEAADPEIEPERVEELSRALAHERAEQRKLVRENSDWLELQTLEWSLTVLQTLKLSGGEVGDDPMELPSYMATQEFVHAVVGHWQTVPLASGG